MKPQRPFCWATFWSSAAKITGEGIINLQRKVPFADLLSIVAWTNHVQEEEHEKLKSMQRSRIRTR